MNDTAKFLIAQYLSDPMRREPKNIGLIVVKDEQCAAKFLGESAEGMDLRTIRWARDAQLYQHWVESWREQIEDGASGLLERLSETNGGNYDVILGGHVSDANGDTARIICERLFPHLVGEPQEEAESVAKGSDTQHIELQRAVHDEFSSLGILAGTSSAPNPVWTHQYVVGKRTTHEPSFLQTADGPTVMEVINFTTTRKGLARDHAGIVAKMFDDILRNDPRAKRVAITRATREDLLSKPVKYAIDLLQDSVDSTVNWEDKDQRKEFLDARLAVAFASPA
jgi:hypothetical protein